MGEPILTRRAAVLGKPIGHSLSPVLHNAGYAAAGLDGWSYTAIECSESELADLIGRLGPEWAGLSLTMPLKDAALMVADEVEPRAAAIGAANTLVRIPTGGWRADNTDAPGMVDALHAVGVGPVTSMAILGAGGTARAAVAVASILNIKTVRVYARRHAAVAEMIGAADALDVVLEYVPWAAAGGAAAADLVVSTVPKGVADNLRPAWTPRSVLFDVVYDPWPTPLVAAAIIAGATVVSGLDLLLHQAARQFTLFTHFPAPVPSMASALFGAVNANY